MVMARLMCNGDGTISEADPKACPGFLPAEASEVTVSSFISTCIDGTGAFGCRGSCDDTATAARV